MEAERFLTDDTWVEDEAALLKAVTAAWVAAVEDRHVVFFCHFVDGCEKADEVLLGVDILLSMSTQQNIPSFLKTKSCMNV